jgi:hypothetical protein
MPDFAASIVSKLTADELSWLEYLIGTSLRDSESVAALVDLKRAHDRIKEIERRALRLRPDMRTAKCCFCDRPAVEAGPLHQSGEFGICVVCTFLAVRDHSEHSGRDA